MDPRARKERWAGILSVNDSDNFYTEAIVKEVQTDGSIDSIYWFIC